MKTLVGGAIAAILGIIGLLVWLPAFGDLLKGVVPVMLLLGGSLAIYLGFDELKDTWKREEASKVDVSFNDDEVAQYKQEIDELKQEVESLKKS